MNLSNNICVDDPNKVIAYSLYLRNNKKYRFEVHSATIEHWFDRDGKGYTFRATTLIEPDKASYCRTGEFVFSDELTKQLTSFYELQRQEKVGILIDHKDVNQSKRYWASRILVKWEPKEPFGKFNFYAGDLEPTAEAFIYE